MASISADAVFITSTLMNVAVPKYKVFAMIIVAKPLKERTFYNNYW